MQNLLALLLGGTKDTIINSVIAFEHIITDALDVLAG